METKKLKTWEQFTTEIQPQCKCWHERVNGDITFLYEYRHWIIPLRIVTLFGEEIEVQEINDMDYLYGMNIILHKAWFE